MDMLLSTVDSNIESTIYINEGVLSLYIPLSSVCPPGVLMDLIIGIVNSSENVKASHIRVSTIAS